jgi:hypothetical protein
MISRSLDLINVRWAAKVGSGLRKARASKEGPYDEKNQDAQ